MRTALIALVSLAGLTACEPSLTSEKPLISAGPDDLRPGLWAMLEEGCATPRTTSVHTWPVCATPFWIGSGNLTYMFPAPNQTPYRLSDGRPMIAELGPREGRSFLEKGEPDEVPKAKLLYDYVMVQPEGASPFAAGRLWILSCPEVDEEAPKIAGATQPGPRDCRAPSVQELRTLAARTTSTDTGAPIVWVAPA